MSVDARCVTNVTGQPGRSWSYDTLWRDINLASCLSTSTHRAPVSFMLYLALDVEPLFYRFKNVLTPFQDLLTPFFTVSDLANSVFTVSDI